MGFIARWFCRVTPEEAHIAECSAWAKQHYGEKQHAIVARVISVVATQQGVAVALIEPNTRFIEDLQMYDHLEGVELGLAIRDEFGLEISEAEGDAMHTVGDLVAHVLRGNASNPT